MKNKLIILSFILSPLTQASIGWTKVLPGTDKTIVKLKDSFGTCTGTRISNNGHILTARHCFNACLISQGHVEVEKIYPEDGYMSPKLYRFKADREAICDQEINGVKTKVKILAIGPAFMTESEKRSLPLYDNPLYHSYLDQDFFHTGDFLIAKELNPTESSCKKINTTTNAPEEQVQYMGYPGASKGRGAHNSDGESLYLAQGKINESIQSNPCVDRGSYSDTVWERVDRTYNRESIILSTVDILPGASGSALLNQEGEIIGLLNSTYAHRVDIFSEYCAGSAVAIKIDHVLNLARNFLSDKALQEAFACEE